MDSNVVDELEPQWEQATIPDESFLYMRVHRHALDLAGRPIPGAFRNSPKGALGMSTNWDKYSNAIWTRNSGPQPPQNYAVVKLPVGNVRRLPGQTVEHTPDYIRRNQSHTDVIGVKDAEVRLGFMRIYILAIEIDEPVEGD